VRALWGAALLAVPGRVIDSVGGPADTATLIVVRVLGLRHLVQSALCGADDRRRKGAVVDLVHALSMAALAAGARRHRRLAATDACVALAFAGSGLRLRHRSEDPITAAVEATVRVTGQGMDDCPATPTRRTRARSGGVWEEGCMRRPLTR
jgi:hypothetical protein